MAIQVKGIRILLVATLFALCGCSVALDLALTGAGQSAQIEKINFFLATDGFVSADSTGAGLPDLFYISPSYDAKKYKKIMVNDFTSLTTDVNKISGLQIPEFKNMRKDIPDNISQSFDGSIFPQCIRSAERVDHTDIDNIKKLSADAVLFGNISELRTGSRSGSYGGGPGLTAAKIEIKLVDRRTGEELIRMITRNSTDGDKVSFPILRQLSSLVKKASENKPTPNYASSVSAGNSKVEQKDAVSASAGTVNVNTASNLTCLTPIKNINIREMKSTKSKIICSAKVGEKLTKIDESGKWFKVKTAQGESGWILKNLVKIVD